MNTSKVVATSKVRHPGQLQRATSLLEDDTAYARFFSELWVSEKGPGVQCGEVTVGGPLFTQLHSCLGTRTQWVVAWAGNSVSVYIKALVTLCLLGQSVFADSKGLSLDLRNKAFPSHQESLQGHDSSVGITLEEWVPNLDRRLKIPAWH